MLCASIGGMLGANRPCVPSIVSVPMCLCFIRDATTTCQVLSSGLVLSLQVGGVLSTIPPDFCFYNITEGLRLEGPSRSHLAQPPAQAGSSGAGCPGPRPGDFGRFPDRRLRNLSGQLVPLLCHLHSTEVLWGWDGALVALLKWTSFLVCPWEHGARVHSHQAFLLRTVQSDCLVITERDDLRVALPYLAVACGWVFVIHKGGCGQPG